MPKSTILDVKRRIGNRVLELNTFQNVDGSYGACTGYYIMPQTNFVTCSFNDAAMTSGWAEYANASPGGSGQFCSKRAGQAMLCCQETDEKSLFRDFGLGNCRKWSVVGFYLHFIRTDCEGQRHETLGWSSRSHRQSAVEPRSDPGSGVSVNLKLGAPRKGARRIVSGDWSHSSPGQWHA